MRRIRNEENQKRVMCKRSFFFLSQHNTANRQAHKLLFLFHLLFLLVSIWAKGCDYFRLLNRTLCEKSDLHYRENIALQKKQRKHCTDESKKYGVFLLQSSVLFFLFVFSPFSVKCFFFFSVKCFFFCKVSVFFFTCVSSCFDLS